jgi:hypothetical protein
MMDDAVEVASGGFRESPAREVEGERRILEALRRDRLGPTWKECVQNLKEVLAAERLALMVS